MQGSTGVPLFPYARLFRSLGRLAASATQEQARAELTGFFARLPTPAWRGEARGVVNGFREMILGDIRPAMRITLLAAAMLLLDRKSTRLNSSHGYISYAVF